MNLSSNKISTKTPATVLENLEALLSWIEENKRDLTPSEIASIKTNLSSFNILQAPKKFLNASISMAKNCQLHWEDQGSRGNIPSDLLNTIIQDLEKIRQTLEKKNEREVKNIIQQTKAKTSRALSGFSKNIRKR